MYVSVLQVLTGIGERGDAAVDEDRQLVPLALELARQLVMQRRHLAVHVGTV